MSTATNYTLEITVIPGRPRIWRQILVPSDIRLPRLHVVIQRVTGAPDSLQRFFVDSQKRIFGHPTWKDFPKIKSDSRVRLDRLLRNAGDTWAYFSGDGDAWEHIVHLSQVRKTARRLSRATCMAGNSPRDRAGKSANRLFHLQRVNHTLRSIRL